MTTDAASVDSDFRQRVVDVMRAILANLLEYSDPITEDMHLMHELGLSSTLGLELLLQLEDRLEILIDVEKMNQDKVSTVGDFATFIAGHSRPA
ncbi:MAG TPA: phosphopantetheine-binding protein [Candidatus Limnocylindrales bacterium]|nr:phosphopantetheine-binding protein [Candidatus Limnocylindrales bacterium]